jgi:hypothetical protein
LGQAEKANRQCDAEIEEGNDNRFGETPDQAVDTTLCEEVAVACHLREKEQSDQTPAPNHASNRGILSDTPQAMLGTEGSHLLFEFAQASAGRRQAIQAARDLAFE